MIQLVCKCGKKFFVKPYRAKIARFCSHHCREWKKYIKDVASQRVWTAEQRKKCGRIWTIKEREKASILMQGEKSPLWRGGVSPLNRKIRYSLEYRLWRDAVFKRDDYTCIWCGDNKGGNLNADHIKRFSEFPELRFAIDNGRTLCVGCHRKTDNWGSRGLKGRKYKI